MRAGQSERDLALDIDWRIRQAGFERPAFETIVASGPNAALPHARPGERKLSEGDLVVLDFGGVYDSYCVDLTRTVSIGPATRARREVYAAVLRGPRSAPSRPSRPGPSRFDDRRGRARGVSTRHGLGEAFGHGTGHGLGIEVHEDPAHHAAAAGRRQPRRSGRGRHGVHHRARRLSSRAGAASGSRTTCWSRRAASSC